MFPEESREVARFAMTWLPPDRELGMPLSGLRRIRQQYQNCGRATFSTQSHWNSGRDELHPEDLRIRFVPITWRRVYRDYPDKIVDHLNQLIDEERVCCHTEMLRRI